MNVIFSKQEKYAIVSVLIKIMEADGIIDPHEIEFLDGVLVDLHISEQEMENIQEYDFGQDIAIFKQLSNEKLNAAKELFINMAKCDGYADPRELQIINSLA
ncbi:MAG: TerB family tellurite resistance protein [Paramuribaculum sp.]|nr:TerB family tellurite resistance protein [Paramuribaculum sp.]